MLAAMSCAGCAERWSTGDADRHLARDVRVGMPRAELMELLSTYPLREPECVRWPSEQEWLSVRVHEPFAPWTVHQYFDGYEDDNRSGSQVVVAYVLPPKSWFAIPVLLLGGIGSIHRWEYVWFEIGSAEQVTVWGRSTFDGTDVDCVRWGVDSHSP